MRKITHTYYGFDMPDVIVKINGQEYRGELRAWALDDETGDWWGMCQYRIAPGQQMLGWIHESGLRRAGDLTDDHGLVDSQD